MDDALIVYLHGFCSAPASHKARKLKARLDMLGLGGCFWCEQLPVSPRAAIHLAEDVIRRNVAVTLVGSSLGGYYATFLAERHGLKAVLINPAVVAPQSLAEFAGMQTNLYTGEVFEFTHQHVAELKELEVPRVSRLERYLLILGMVDELLDYRHAASKYAEAKQILVPGGDHGLPEFGQYVDEVLRFAGLVSDQSTP